MVRFCDAEWGQKCGLTANRRGFCRCGGRRCRSESSAPATRSAPRRMHGIGARHSTRARLPRTRRPGVGIVIERVDDLDAPIAQRGKPDEAFACLDPCDLRDHSDREAVLAAPTSLRRSLSTTPNSGGSSPRMVQSIAMERSWNARSAVGIAGNSTEPRGNIGMTVKFLRFHGFLRVCTQPSGQSRRAKCLTHAP